MIRWNAPKFDGREAEYVKEVLDSGFVSEGPKTKLVEEKLSKIVKTKHIILTTSATAALYLAIEADKRIHGYTEGEVIIPALTMVGTKNAVELANLTPRIEDVDPSDFMLSTTISLARLPKIILQVNLLGRGREKELINSLQPFTVICDNAGCLGSDVPNGKVGCYSLQANKLLNCGQGGFCATDSDEYAKEIRKIKDFGRDHKDQNDTTGFNFKFNDIQAAVLLGQLEVFGSKVFQHRWQFEEYRKALSSYGLFPVFDIEHEIPLWVEFELGVKETRDQLYDYLLSKGIESRKPWKPLIDLPVSTHYYETVLWLPNGDSLSVNDQIFVIKTIKGFFNGI